MSAIPPSNEQIADILDDVARLLESQEANPFRVRSYRQAAQQIRQLDEPAADIYEEGGESGLRSLEGIGRKLASSIREII